MDKYIRVLNAIDDNWAIREAKVAPEDLSTQLQKVENWCKQYCNGEWVNVCSLFYFKEDKDVTLFSLRWS